ncbi:MAG: hypothetical protein JOZ02_16830 [Acidobacteria bacterium]|nr:hypothetical protein [Acidobacteriota bacterium]
MTIVAGAAAAVTLVTGLVLFKLNSDEQERVATLGVLQEHLKLSVEHPQFADGKYVGDEKEQYEWFASHALFTAETIYLMQEGDEGWEQTVRGIVERHANYLVSEKQRCQDFNPKFIEFVRGAVPGLNCESR